MSECFKINKLNVTIGGNMGYKQRVNVTKIISNKVVDGKMKMLTFGKF